MPHDKHDQELLAGDRVTVEFIVKSVCAGENHCNVNLESVEGMPPDGYKTTLSAINTRQTVKVSEKVSD